MFSRLSNFARAVGTNSDIDDISNLTLTLGNNFKAHEGGQSDVVNMRIRSDTIS